MQCAPGDRGAEHPIDIPRKCRIPEAPVSRVFGVCTSPLSHFPPPRSPTMTPPQCRSIVIASPLNDTENLSNGRKRAEKGTETAWERNGRRLPEGLSGSVGRHPALKTPEITHKHAADCEKTIQRSHSCGGLRTRCRNGTERSRN